MNYNVKTVMVFWIVFMGHVEAQVNFGSLLQKAGDEAGKVAADKGPGLAKSLEDKVIKKKSPSAPKDSAALMAQSDAGFRLYAGYDFVPCEHVIFEDHFADDQTGEFPSLWQLSSGQAEVSLTTGEKVLAVTSGHDGRVGPKLTDGKYLTDTFSLEFQYYLARPKGSPEAAPVKVFLKSRSGYDATLTISKNTVDYDDAHGVKLSNDLHTEIRGDTFANKWHHIALLYRNKQLKVYVDQYKTLVIPDTKAGYVSMEIGGAGTEQAAIVFGDVRIASGGGLYPAGRKYTGKALITHGIDFYPGHAILRPESMGTLNMIVQVMRDNPDIKFEIGVHTDSDGDAVAGLTLSQQRADAVRARLAKMGIDPARLTAKGYGMAKPKTDNDTPIGKANNRRVELVKI